MDRQKEFMISQLSVFLDNRPGSLAKVARYLADNDINLRALSLAETRDFGTARLIVADPPSCAAALEVGGYHFIESDVIAVAVADHPGGMADFLDLIAAENMDVEYIYASVIKFHKMAVIIVRVKDPVKVAVILRSQGVKLLSKGDIAAL
jgi:hypothetical protein